jgi:hypothetical protein
VEAGCIGGQNGGPISVRVLRAGRSGIAFAMLAVMRMRPRLLHAGWLLLFVAASPALVSAQDAAPPATSNPDSRLDPLQPDFNLAALPTTLRLPEHKMAFRVTHRFTRSLGRGDFSELLNDFFGFDSGAQIGLELRYGLLPGTQLGIHRTSDRTIEIFGQHNLWQQKPDGHPLGIDVIATLEGTNNLRAQKSSALGLLVSRKVGKVAALYAEPLFVVNSSRFDTGDNNTSMIGLGARVRIRPATYLIGEVTPRLSGYKPGVDQGSFGIEMRAGGHTFQINFSNGVGTTLGQLTRSGVTSDTWYIGFNISRKFF